MSDQTQQVIPEWRNQLLEKVMLDRLKILFVENARGASRHRVMYVGLSFSYGLACFGIADKWIVNALVTSIYLIMALRA